ncbi:membrane protein insertion efficiency factor YidD, partial [Campylobacter coli]|nr:membrane protein insertion efficiency factor YidD [Campylobacter coli]
AQKQLYFLYIPHHQDKSFYLVKIIFQRANK